MGQVELDKRLNLKLQCVGNQKTVLKPVTLKKNNK